MNKILYTFFAITFLSIFLFGCGSKIEIVGNTEESKIYVSDDGDLITFYALIENKGSTTSENLFAKFEITHEQLATELGQKSILFSDDGHIPSGFKISGDSAYFISEAFTYEGNIPHEELAGAVDVVIFNESNNEITRFSIEQVEKE